MAISLGSVLGFALNAAVLGLDVAPPIVASMGFLLLRRKEQSLLSRGSPQVSQYPLGKIIDE